MRICGIIPLCYTLTLNCVHFNTERRREAKRILSFFGSKKMVFTRVFIIGHKTLLTTMYLFLEKEKKSLQW